MRTRPCSKCGKPIAFVVSERSGKSAAVDPEPEGRYVPRENQDRDEPRAEYRRVYRAHQETCGR